MSQPNPPIPLQTFVRLGQNIFLYTPKETVPSGLDRVSHGAEPSLIILCSWMAAAPKNIAKYVEGYQQLYPSSRILLLTNELIDFFRPSRSHFRRLSPALDVVVATVDHNENNEASISPRSGILLHLFSNGGAKIATHLALLYRQRTQTPLPIDALILDSCPGSATTISAGVRASMSAYPPVFAGVLSKLTRFLVTGLAWMTMILWFLAVKIRLMGHRGKGPVTVLRRLLNDPTIVPLHCVRTYVYSVADKLVDWRDVEAHAEEAERSGWKVMRIRFEDSPHVAHMMVDPARYWKAVVRATFEMACGLRN